MARRFNCVSLAILAGLFCSGNAECRSRPHQDPNASVSIPVGSPTLAPFQHVRFCLHYPADCKSDATESDRIELNADTSELLKRINRSVNESIIPIVKSYGANLGDGWAIAPDMGDCNDYAVTKRHELLASGLPSKAMRLSVVKTADGIGHLVLVVATTTGNLVLDNLSEAIRPWQSTGYQWIKIQSANDAKFWYEVKTPVAAASLARETMIRLADR
jgi:predicted transglutaminase-like cysteine proteinase